MLLRGQGIEHGWLRGIAAMILSLVICALLLTAVCMIPQSRIQTQSEKTAAYLMGRAEFLPLLGKRVNKIQDNFADAELMGIAYGIDSRHPFASAIRAEYAQAEGETAAQGYQRQVQGKKSPGRSYSRYWHGSLVYIRPLLLFLLQSGGLKTVRDGLGKILGCGLWWAAGYVTAFCTKLALVYLVCGRSEVVESLRAGAVRIGGQVHMGNTNLTPEATTMQRLSGAIWHNLSALSFAEYDHMTMAGALLPADVETDHGPFPFL